MKILFFLPISCYIYSRLITHSILTLTVFAANQFMLTIPFFTVLAQSFFKFLVSQVVYIRIILNLVFRFIIFPLFELATPFIEFAIEISLQFFYKAYKLHLEYTPKIMEKTRETLQIWALQFWIFYNTYFLNFFNQTYEVFKIVLPMMGNAIWSFFEFCDRIHSKLRPIIDPYIRFFLLQVQLVLVIFSRLVLVSCQSIWKVLTSPYNLALFSIQSLSPYFFKAAHVVFDILDEVILLSTRAASLGLQKLVQVMEWTRNTYLYILKTTIYYWTITKQYAIKQYKDYQVEERFWKSVALIQLYISMTMDQIQNLFNTSMKFGEDSIVLLSIQMQNLIDYLNESNGNSSASGFQEDHT